MTRIFTLALSIISVSCGITKYEKALIEAGDNRAELEKVIVHYDSIGDELKKQAALFLIENMIGKHSTEFRDTSSHNKLLRYLNNINDPIGWDPAFSFISLKMDSILRIYPVINTVNSDLQTITSKYLIDNIDNAFSVWGNAPWRNDYTFSDFCHYVLPYKIDHEAIYNWRTKALANNAPTEDSLMNNGGSAWKMAVALINNTGLYYNIGMSRFPYPMNFRDLDIVRRGACGQMADLALYYFRSRAIPSAIDVIPAWANRSSSHSWNSIILPGGKSQSIGYRPDGTNDLAYKVSKIYRKTYEQQPAPNMSKGEVLTRFFDNQYIVDVTAQYDMPLSDVIIDLTIEAPCNLVYLSTFNNNSWTTVAFAEKQNKRVTFKNLGRGILPKKSDNLIRYINQGNGIVYLPVYSLEQGIVTAGNPFILDTLGTVTPLIPSGQVEDARLYRKYPKHPKYASLAPNEKTPDDNDIIGGQEYELLYWDGGWVSLGREIAQHDYLDYKVPKGALMWLRNHTKGVEERIFVMKDGKQMWF